MNALSLNPIGVIHSCFKEKFGVSPSEFGKPENKEGFVQPAQSIPEM